MVTNELSEGKLPTRRERTRAATVEEIKQTALSLMRDNATIDIRFADIAREMGLTPPALYRYFADRDELLTAMIVDGFVDLGGALALAAAAMPVDRLGERLLATAQAYRQWAKRDPQRFTLIFGLPVPGYAAPHDGPTVDAAKRAMSNLGDIVREAMIRGVAQPPLIPDVNPVVGECLLEKQLPGESIPLATHQSMLHGWAALHGFVCLEAYGHLHWFEEQARDELFVGLVRLTALGMGVPAPPTGG